MAPWGTIHSGFSVTAGSRCAAPRITLAAVAVLAGAVAGCALSGSWRTVSVEPPGAPAPIDRIDFGADGRYTASWSDDGDTRTSVGAYRWSGNTLTVTQTGREPRRYRLRRRLDGKLALVYEGDNAQVVAVLERQGE